MSPWGFSPVFFFHWVREREPSLIGALPTCTQSGPILKRPSDKGTHPSIPTSRALSSWQLIGFSRVSSQSWAEYPRPRVPSLIRSFAQKKTIPSKTNMQMRLSVRKLSGALGLWNSRHIGIAGRVQGPFRVRTWLLPKNGWQIWHRFPVSSLDYRLLFDVRRRNSTPLDDSNEKKTIKTKRRSERRLGPSIDGAPHSDAGAAENKNKNMRNKCRSIWGRIGPERAANYWGPLAKEMQSQKSTRLPSGIGSSKSLPSCSALLIRPGRSGRFATATTPHLHAHLHADIDHRLSHLPPPDCPSFRWLCLGFFRFFFCCSSFCVPVVSISAPECSECRCSRMRKRNRDFTAVCVRKVTQIRSPPPAPETFFHSLKTGLSRT